MLEEKKKKQPKHILAVVQVLVLKTSFPHKHTHTFLITYSIPSSTHPLLTSFIHSTQLLNIHGVPSSEQNRQVSALTGTTVWRRKQTLQQLPPSWGWGGGNSTKGGCCLVPGSHGNYARRSDTQAEEREEWMEESSTREEKCPRLELE